jgi:PKD repeat protein
VFADFSFTPQYPKPGETIAFHDESQGSVTLWEWDFDGDGVIDSNSHRPEFVYTEEGEYQASLTVWSEAGLNSTITRRVEVREHWPPVAVASPEYYGGKGHVVDFLGGGSYHVDDEKYIVSYSWDFDDGTGSSDANPVHEFPSENGVYNVSLTVVDNEGYSDVAVCDIRVDKSAPPETTFQVGTCDLDEWFKHDVQGTLTSRDWSGVDMMFYRVDGGEWHELDSIYDAREMFYPYVMVSGEGEHKVEFYAVDKYGNVESTKYEMVRIDMSPPSVEVSLSGEQVDGWFIEPPVVSLSGRDGGSGVDGLKYRVDYGWRSYSGSFVIDDVFGTVVFDCLAVDNAGNIGLESVEVQIESPPTKPVISGPGSGVVGETYSYGFVSSDFFRGDDVYYFVDWGDGSDSGWQGPFGSGEGVTLSHRWDSEGGFVIRAKAKDVWGAESDWSELSVRMPRSRVLLVVFRLLERYPGWFPVLRTYLGL